MKTYINTSTGIYLTEEEIEREYNAFADREEYPTFDNWLNCMLSSCELDMIKGDWFIARTCDDLFISDHDTLTEAKAAVKELEAEDREHGEFSRDAYKILPANDAKLYMLVDDHTTHGAIVDVETFDSEEEAIERAAYIWGHMIDSDKKRTDAFYVQVSIDPDPESERYYEGDIIRRWK